MDQAERVKVRALAHRVAEEVDEWIDEFDPDGLSGNVRRLALDYRAELRAWLPEIKRAGESGDQAELESIVGKVQEVSDRAERFGVLAEIGRQREAIERAAELAERQAEWAEQAEREARQAEQAEREAARRAEIEARAQRKAIAGPAARTTVTRIPDSNGYVAAAAGLIGMIEQSRAIKERKLSEHGPCGYQHKKPTVPERRYWITTLDWQGNQSGHELPGFPAVVVCSKHFAAADQWIQEQAALIASQHRVNVLAVHTELK